MNFEDFKQERDNLIKIRKIAKNRHITQSFESFSQGGRGYIVFPWAQGGDLDNFWQSQNQTPRTPQLALWCLKQMLGLSEALYSLHEEIGKEANCRHGDLKPGNILHFHTGGARGVLKISDFGISRIHNKATFKRTENDTKTRATSPSYEAPEAAGPKKARSRKYDIWSLGCIFLEFAIWLVQDWSAVKDFDNARKPNVTSNDGTDSTHFYEVLDRSNNKFIVHPEVLRRIKHLSKMTQSSHGTALGDLLNIIKNNLVRIEVDDRIDAKGLCERLEEIVKKAKSSSVYLFNSQ